MHKRAFLILFACLVCVGMGGAMLFAILPPAAREIGLSPFQVSTIFAASATIWIFVSPMWGRRSDVAGRRPVILTGLLGFALSMALLTTVTQIGLWQLLPAMTIYPLMIASRCVFALLGSGTGPASLAYVADRTSRTERTAGVALLSAAMGTGQTIGPALGAAIAPIGLLAPLYFVAGVAVLSSLAIWLYLPEGGPPIEPGQQRPPRLSFRDRRVIPFLLLAAALQAVQSTTTITLAFFLQDTLALSAQETVQYAGVGFTTFAVSGLFVQLVVVQRFRPSARFMIRTGVVFALAAFVLLVAGKGFPAYLIALVSLGVGAGLLRPGNAAAASLAVEPHEQGSVAGLISAIGVIGNVFGPLVGTSLYQLTLIGPYVLNATLMALALVFVLTNWRLRNIRA